MCSKRHFLFGVFVSCASFLSCLELFFVFSFRLILLNARLSLFASSLDFCGRVFLFSFAAAAAGGDTFDLHRF